VIRLARLFSAGTDNPTQMRPLVLHCLLLLQFPLTVNPFVSDEGIRRFL
jgi:hypothetical protein